MSKNPHTITSHHSTARGTLHSYTTGLILSIILTVVAYIFAVNDLLTGTTLMLMLGLFAVIQLGVQLKFFIHLDNEEKPRWNKVIFLFMILIVGIIAIGSIWIMNNLNYNMHRMQPETDLQEQKGGI